MLVCYHHAVCCFASALIVYVNFLGTKSAAKFQNILTCIIAGVGLLLVAGSAVTGDMGNLSAQKFVGNSISEIFGNVCKVSIMTPFFLFGFDIIPQAAEEINVPKRRIGQLMMLSIGMAVVFYTLVVLAIGYVMSPIQVRESMVETGMVTADAIAVAFSNEAMTKVLIIGGLCGIVTTWNSFLIGGSRVLFSMSKARMLPSIFSRLHVEHKTPYISILFLGVVSMITPFFGRVMLIWIVDAANFACCLAYCIVALSFLVLRRKQPYMNRPFCVKGGKIIGIFAAIMAGFMGLMYIIPGTNCSLDCHEWLIVVGWAICGVFLAFRAVRVYKEKFGCIMDAD